MLLLLVVAGCSRNATSTTLHNTTTLMPTNGSLVNPGLGSIIVFEPDPDGTEIHVLEYP